jgi:Starch-binding associating with outer membrane
MILLAGDLSKSGLTSLASKFTPRFTNQNATGTITCASQIYLHAAEAATLGWIADNAEDLYHKGIKASFDLNNLSNSDYQAYIAQPKVKLMAGDVAGNVKKISLQKWIQGFGQDCFESWAEWRRNRVPDLRIGPAAGADLEGKEMPDRMYYASGDYTSNREQYEKAIATQGPDNYFTKLWWGK